MAAAEILQEGLGRNTVLIFGVIVGFLLLFGSWDAQSGFFALVIAGLILVYLVTYKSINLQWET